jgi:hypothetical protein
MPTPTTPERRLLAAGAKKGSAWGTAVALGAGDGLLIVSDGGPTRKQPNSPSKEHDTPFVRTGDLGAIDPVDFALSFFMRYDPGRLGTLLAMIYGTAGTPSLLGTTAYKHIFQFKDTIEGLFATYAKEIPGKIHEIASAKPYAVEFSIAEGLLQASLSLRGNKLIDDSAINTATQMDALTYPDRYNRVKFPELVVKMNDESGADVALETALVINGLTISIARSPDAVPPAGQDHILEPLETDHPQVTVKLSFPRANSINTAFFQKFTAETPQKLLAKFTGKLIEETYYYDLAFYFPRLKFSPDPPTYADNEVVPAEITLVAEEAAAAPTGMSYARPYLELINKATTDYLA